MMLEIDSPDKELGLRVGRPGFSSALGALWKGDPENGKDGPPLSGGLAPARGLGGPSRGARSLSEK